MTAPDTTAPTVTREEAEALLAKIRAIPAGAWLVMNSAVADALKAARTVAEGALAALDRIDDMARDRDNIERDMQQRDAHDEAQREQIKSQGDEIERLRLAAKNAVLAFHDWPEFRSDHADSERRGALDALAEALHTDPTTPAARGGEPF